MIKKNKNKTVSVTMTKVYTYPESILSNPENDHDLTAELKHFVTKDIFIELNENKVKDIETFEKLFDVEITRNPKFEILKPLPKKKGMVNIRLQRIIEAVANLLMNQKYGKDIDPDISPELFVKIAPIMLGNKIAIAERIVMNPEVNEDYNIFMNIAEQTIFKIAESPL